MDWETKAGTCHGALVNIITEAESALAANMPRLALASIGAYARDVLARTGYEGGAQVAGATQVAAVLVPTGTGWPVK